MSHYIARGLAFWPRTGPDCRHGYNDSRLPSGTIPTFHEHYSQCFDERAGGGIRRHDAQRRPHPYSAVDSGRVSTWYATFYRIASADYLTVGSEFPRNWEDSERKTNSIERYSPKGVVGHYLGLTLDACFDEATHYGHGTIDGAGKVLLAIECYFDNILYLAHAGVALAVFQILGLPARDAFDCTLQLMLAETGNPITDRIGLWAREEGFEGIIFPSARWGARTDIDRLVQSGKTPYPLVNHVKLGTMMDVMANADLSEAFLNQRIRADGTYNKDQLIPAEPNLVLFSGRQLTAVDRAVFYQVMPLAYGQHLREEETRRQSKNNAFYVDL